MLVEEGKSKTVCARSQTSDILTDKFRAGEYQKGWITKFLNSGMAILLEN